jgi:hypothetical protein
MVTTNNAFYELVYIITILTCVASLWHFLNQPNSTSHILKLFTSGLLILLLNTFCHEWSRIVRLCKEFLYIISFNVYTVSKTLFDATELNLSVSHFRYIWTLFLLLNTFWQELSRLVTPCNEFLYNISLPCIPALTLFLMQHKTSYRFSRTLHLDSVYTVEHILALMVTQFNAL